MSKFNYKLLIIGIVAAYSVITPPTSAAITFPSFPTIQDQIFNFPGYDLRPPRIPLKFIRGVVGDML